LPPVRHHSSVPDRNRPVQWALMLSPRAPPGGGSSGLTGWTMIAFSVGDGQPYDPRGR
jgi:hypothetical protein